MCFRVPTFGWFLAIAASSPAGGTEPIVGPDPIYLEEKGFVGVEAEHFVAPRHRERRARFDTGEWRISSSPDQTGQWYSTVNYGRGLAEGAPVIGHDQLNGIFPVTSR